VLRDVIVHRTGPDELLALSQAPGLLGEEMTLDVIGGGSSLGVRVRVIDSRPVIVDGSVRHRIRLSLVNHRTVTPAVSGNDEAGDAAIGGAFAEAL
jgi:sulfate adenylyltransferase subunit 1 (EFTu-like GTPase family)